MNWVEACEKVVELYSPPRVTKELERGRIAVVDRRRHPDLDKELLSELTRRISLMTCGRVITTKRTICKTHEIT